MAKKKAPDAPVTTPTETNEALVEAVGEAKGTRRVVAIMEGEREIGHAFLCPACDCPHPVYDGIDEGIEFSGTAREPTFTPAVEFRFVTGVGQEQQVCNSTVTEGRITFLEGSTHDMVGETATLPTFTAVAGEMSHGT